MCALILRDLLLTHVWTGSGASRDSGQIGGLLYFAPLFLCECHCPFRLARQAMAPTATAKRELSLANPMRELNAGNRDRLPPSINFLAQGPRGIRQVQHPVSRLRSTFKFR